MARVFLVVPVLALALSPVPAAPIPEGAGKPAVYYFPVAPGAKWVYDCPDERTETVVVARAGKTDGEWIVEREAADGDRQRYAKVAVSAQGLRQDNLNSRPEPIWLLKTPFRDGDSWDVPAGHGGGKRTVHGPELVAVPAGKFQAARVVWERPGGRTLTSWYAPGVGEIKRVDHAADGTEEVLRSLKSFTAGRDDR